jgi:hypothetical protein
MYLERLRPIAILGRRMISPKVDFTVRLLPPSKDKITLEGQLQFPLDSDLVSRGGAKLTPARGHPARGKGDEMIALCPLLVAFLPTFLFTPSGKLMRSLTLFRVPLDAKV